MVRDLELIKDITPLFEKEIVIWGVGISWKKIYDELRLMGAGKKGILFADNDYEKVGKRIDYDILMPTELIKRTTEYVIIISVENAQIQDEIIQQIKEYRIQQDIYTKYAFYASIYLNLKDLRLNKAYREKVEDE